MPKDAEQTRQRILDAALVEFAERGSAGARVESIAKRVGTSVRMLYVYFGNKQGLYEAVLREHLDQRATLADPAQPFTEYVTRHFDSLLADDIFVRLIMWEALDSGRQPPVSAERRATGYEEALEYLKSKQDKGELDAALDPEMILIAVLALTSFPLAFGQIIQMITGKSPTNPDFAERYSRFLQTLAGRLTSTHERTEAGGQDR